MGLKSYRMKFKHMLEIKKLLIYILMFPIIGILLLVFLPNQNEKLLKVVALNSACLSFSGSCAV